MAINQKIIEEVEVPEGISANIQNGLIILKKNNEENTLKTNSKIKITAQANKIIFEANRATRNNKKIIGTFVAHLKNMIKGFKEKFQYKLQISNVHFPMTVTVDKAKNEVVVKNFLGEKKDRKIRILNGVEVKVNKGIIEVESANIEKAGQCAADIEKGTKVRNRDRRIFQDGIFIIEKPGRSLE